MPYAAGRGAVRPARCGFPPVSGADAPLHRAALCTCTDQPKGCAADLGFPTHQVDQWQRPKALVEVVLGDLAGGGGDRAERSEYSSGDDPAESERDHHHDGQRDDGDHQESMEVCLLGVPRGRRGESQRL